MLSREDILHKIIEAVNDSMMISDVVVNENTHLIHDLQADSVDVATMLMELEAEHNISIPDEELHRLKDMNLGQFADFLMSIQA